MQFGIGQNGTDRLLKSSLLLAPKCPCLKLLDRHQTTYPHKKEIKDKWDLIICTAGIAK